MRNIGLWAFLAIVAVVANLGCRDGREITEATGDMRVVVDGNNGYALDLYGTVAGEPGNVFFSPFSVTAGTSMVYAGAEGETDDQIAAAMGVDIDEDAWHENLGALFDDLSGEHFRGYTLHSANAVWGDEAVPFRDSFTTLMEDAYGAPPEEKDFSANPEAARSDINRWVDNQTKGHIDELFESGDIGAETVLVLVNAIYFKADWAEKFRKDDTRDAVFTLPGGDEVTVPLMSLDEVELGYAAVDGAQLLEMDYEDEELSMVVVLPDDVDGLPALEATLDAGTLAGWIDAIEDHTVIVDMPSFELDYELPLQESMEALGMVDMYDPGAADLTGFVAGEDMAANWYVGVARHKAYVKVDEQGTEAAAATGFGVEYTALPDYPEFRADHPFLFLIRDKLTGAILFIGRIEDPRD